METSLDESLLSLAAIRSSGRDPAALAEARFYRRIGRSFGAFRGRS
jgi:hypothetical protein